MTHDPLCYHVAPRYEENRGYWGVCVCSLISRVREDERIRNQTQRKLEYDAMPNAANYITAEHRALIDLYVLEQGPLSVEQTADGSRFVAKQTALLRLKDAEEIRRDERVKARERVLALRRKPQREDVMWTVDAYNVAIVGAAAAAGGTDG